MENGSAHRLIEQLVLLTSDRRCSSTTIPGSNCWSAARLLHDCLRRRLLVQLDTLDLQQGGQSQAMNQRRLHGELAMLGATVTVLPSLIL